jgi:hypothetical protein
MKIDKTETREERYRGSISRDELLDLLKREVMVEAGIGAWTSGVSIDAKAIIDPDSELTEIQFELTVDHLHFRKTAIAGE